MPRPEHFITCGGLPPDRAQRSSLGLDLRRDAEPKNKIELRLDAITRQLADDIPPILADAMEIATYVYSADRLIKRSSPFMDKMNAGWQRNMRFRIPVRQPSIWLRREVQDALIGALSFLSDDYFGFEFVQSTTRDGFQLYLGFDDPGARALQPDEVMLFSGGLDSLGGAVDGLIRHNRKMVLVSHQSATQVRKSQRELVDLLRYRVGPRRFSHVSVRVTKGKGSQDPVEYTQRTRSFLFATLGVTIARMHGLDSVEIAENGITSFNLPISEHVVGSLSSRTTHPRVLADFGRLFSLLLDREIRIRNRFIWSTKGEIVRGIADNGATDLIARTTSCAGVRAMSMSGQHCGVCSQCIERRISIAAAGLEESETKQTYATDLFTGAHDRIQDLSMVEQYVLRAYRHKSMTTEDFLASQGQVFRALRYLDGRPDENAYRVAQLHHRHGASVVKIIDAELKKLDLDATLALPANSLLAMIRPSSGLNITAPDPIRVEPVPSLAAAADLSQIKSRQIIMAVDRAIKWVIFDEGPAIKGKVAFELLARLAKQYEEDTQEKLPLKQFRYLPTRSLTTELKAKDEATFRKRVQRVRDQLEEAFLRSCSYHLDRDDIIENASWDGYRLNPYVRLIESSQVSPAVQMSRTADDNVTTRIAAQ